MKVASESAEVGNQSIGPTDWPASEFNYSAST